MENTVAHHTVQPMYFRKPHAGIHLRIDTMYAEPFDEPGKPPMEKTIAAHLTEVFKGGHAELRLAGRALAPDMTPSLIDIPAVNMPIKVLWGDINAGFVIPEKQPGHLSVFAGAYFSDGQIEVSSILLFKPEAFPLAIRRWDKPDEDLRMDIGRLCFLARHALEERWRWSYRLPRSAVQCFDPFDFWGAATTDTH